jgi:hypothetical protein
MSIFDLNLMFYCAYMLERTNFMCLTIYFLRILIRRICHYSTYHYWRILNQFHYIVEVQAFLHVCIGICVKLAWKKQSKLGDVYCFYKKNKCKNFYFYFCMMFFMFELITNCCMFFLYKAMVIEAFALEAPTN